MLLPQSQRPVAKQSAAQSWTTRNRESTVGPGSASPRRDGPFVALNRAGLADDLSGAELCGYTETG